MIKESIRGIPTFDINIRNSGSTSLRSSDDMWKKLNFTFGNNFKGSIRQSGALEPDSPQILKTPKKHREQLILSNPQVFSPKTQSDNQPSTVFTSTKGLEQSQTFKSPREPQQIPMNRNESKNSHLSQISEALKQFQETQPSSKFQRSYKDTSNYKFELPNMNAPEEDKFCLFSCFGK